MQEKDMKTAGWACVVSAVTTLPLSILAFFVGAAEAKTEGVILSITTLFLFIYILHSLRRLLNEEYNFHLVDSYITFLMGVSVVVTTISAAVTKPGAAFAIFALIALMSYGVVMIIFAITLMKLEDQLAGLLKPFCYLCIAQGVCKASIILIPLGLLVSMAADIVLALIFFRTADKVSSNTDVDI
jgi:hypothetical protein